MHYNSLLKTFEPSSPDAQKGMELRAELPDTDKYYYSWGYIVYKYSTTTMTYGTDKLVAIAGVARFLKPMLQNDIYVTGLSAAATTRDTPPSTTGLLVSHGHSSTRRCIEYRSSIFDQEEWDITRDVFGPISTPAVKVKAVGTLRPVRLRDVRNYALQVFPASVLDISPPLPQILTERRHTARADLDFPVSDNDIPDMETRVFYAMDWIKGEYACDFLLFELAEDENMARYRRIGTFAFNLEYDADSLAGYLTAPYDESDFESLILDSVITHPTKVPYLSSGYWLVV
ncbi:hypothetical protein B0H63DRAFT_448644 [Podospora didyma]|uniref:Uncharacterized protein n=1 Tax=Podospora didyma TaxID=330526 RepID=A0AAE0NU89_9PEZI|nr:hypothetical protein B0H63DRAFT_448644 [Podospora didyma]